MNIIEAIATMNESRPPATTFAEGQQALMIKLLARCGYACTIMVAALAATLIRGHWSPAAENTILTILGLIVGFYALTNLVVVASFSLGGPVGRLDLEATRQGFKLGAAKGDQSDAAK